MKYFWAVCIVLILFFSIAFVTADGAPNKPAGPKHESVNCYKGTGVLEPQDHDPYHENKPPKKMGVVETYVWVTCYSHHPDSVQEVQVYDLSLWRGTGAKLRKICSTNTRGYQLMRKVPLGPGTFMATFELPLECAARRVAVKFTWRAHAEIRLRTEWRNAKTAYKVRDLWSGTRELNLR